ncbi:MAG TPA: OmpA family protein, partial [Bacteroidia bacterium]|nr:OmpA family protein [Bacteroidia bacterium]
MKLIRLTLILLVFMNVSRSYGQDTLSIYFNTGISKIHEEQTNILNTIPTRYDLSDLDSVYFIGLADSVGDAKLNLKLSEKRAKNIAAYCEKFISKTTVTKIIARGESTLEQAEKNRKVSIVLYFSPEKTEMVDTLKVIPKKESCYNVDYNLIKHAHIRTIIKGKKRLMLIQARLE